MKNKTNKLLTLLLAVSAINVTSCTVTDNSNKLVIGLECAYQPFNWQVNDESDHTLPIYGTNQYATGYDIDVAKYLSNDLGMEVVVKKIEWGSLIPSLQMGEINMILAGMSSTAERRLTVDFTDPYLSSDLAFLIKKEHIPEGNSITNPLNYEGLLELFDGHSLICQMGVVGDDLIETYFSTAEGYNIIHNSPLETYPLAALDVANGVSFAMPAELPVIEAMTNLDPSLGVLYCDYSFMSEGDLEGLSVNIAVKQGNDELRNKLNASLAKLSEEDRASMMGAACLQYGN